MNEMQIFNNPEFGKVRTISIDGEPWLVGKDVALALGYKDPINALKAHVDDEDKKGGWRITTPSGKQQMTVINESGVYSLIFSSKLPKAKEFKRWVTSEVLPAIRKQGGYLTPEAADQLAAAVQERVRESIMEPLQTLAARVEALEDAVTDPFRPAPDLSAHQLSAPGEDEVPEPQAPGGAYMKRWMRTASEKLTLLSNKFRMGNNAILSQLYRYLEKDFGVDLAEERIRIIEEYGLGDCSTLKAIFHDAEFRDDFECLVDYNLAPENRGW